MGWWKSEQLDSFPHRAVAGGAATRAAEALVADDSVRTVVASTSTSTPPAPSPSLGPSIMLSPPSSLGNNVHDGIPTISGSGNLGRLQGGGGGDQPECSEQNDMEDEYGSWDHFLGDPGLEALLSGVTSRAINGTTQSEYTQTQQDNQEQKEPGAEEQDEQLAAEIAMATAMEEAAAVAKRQKEKEETWRSLAAGARAFVLPHLPEILKRAWTSARYAQGDPSSSTGSLQAVAPSHVTPGGGGVGVHGGRVGFAGGSRYTSSNITTPVAMTMSFSARNVGAAVALANLEVDAGVVLKVHASAALLALRGSMYGVNGDDKSYSDNRGDNGHHFDYSSVREKYLELYRTALNPLVPQQRLLAPAFFCLVLDSACEGSKNSGVGGGSSPDIGNTVPQEGDTHHGSSRRDDREQNFQWWLGPSPADVRPPRLLLRETLRGREWEVLQLWMQAALDPIAFPVPPRRGGGNRDHRGRRYSSRGDWNRTGGGRGSGDGAGTDEPSDIVRERFEAFTHCIAKAFGSGVGEKWGNRAAGDCDGGGVQRTRPNADDVTGVFEKRLTRFDLGQRAVLSRDEDKAR